MCGRKIFLGRQRGVEFYPEVVDCQHTGAQNGLRLMEEDKAKK